jgi:hypothetical protein
MSVAILANFNPDRDIIVEIDASNYVLTSALSQCHDDNVVHPVTYFSNKHTCAECNYQTYNKELIATVQTFPVWCPELHCNMNPICVLPGNKHLKYFMMTILLNCR